MLKIKLPTRKELEDPKILSRLFEAMRHVESRGNPNARSAKGAEGTMQVMTEIHEKGPGYGVPPLPKDATPEQKQAHGEKYILGLYQRYGNLPDALLAYNMGPGAFNEWVRAGRDPKRLKKEAREYVGKVTYAYRMLHFGQPLKRRDGGAVEEGRQGVGSLAERARQMFNDGGAVSSGSWVDGLRAGLGSMADRARGMFGAVASRPMSEQELEDEAAMEQAAGMRGLASSPSAGMSPEDAQYYAEGLRDELVPEDLTSAGLMAASMLPAGRAARIGIGGLLMAADPSEAEAGWKKRLTDAVTQSVTSAGTSINQVPALFKSKVFAPRQGAVNLDIGGGKYDTASKYLAQERGVTNYVYDPFNRSSEHNEMVLRAITKTPPETVTAANVLNVIPERDARMDVIQKASDYLSPGGNAYFSIYEGDRSGVRALTSKGFQHNKKASEFLGEVQEVFPDARVVGNTIIAPKPRAAADEASTAARGTEKVGLFSGKAVNAERIPEDVPAQDVLVLMACGGQKVSTSSPVPLTGLYCGPMWQTFRTRQGAVSDSQVHVLSGELGLVPGTTKALPYEKVLTPEKSKEVLEQLAETQKQFVRPDGRPWDAVIIAGGGKYRDTFEEVVSRLKSQGIVNPEAAVVATRGGIGDQRKALGEFLGQANARPADRGPMMKAGGGEVRSGVGSLAAVARGMMRRAS